MVNEQAVQTLRAALERIQSNTGDPYYQAAAQIIAAKERVLARYAPVFSPDRIDQLDTDTFRGFLLFKNNQHWTNLQRQGGRMTADMDELRRALALLVDESPPLRTRLNRLRPPHGEPMVKGLARSVITAILQIVYPDKYGVLNNTAEAGMKQVGIWPDMKTTASLADRYEAVNKVLLETADAMGLDLWTLDSIWWRLAPPRSPKFEPAEVGPPAPSATTADIASDEEPAFGLERHLHVFLVDNWTATELGREWCLLEEDGEITGSEYDTREVGSIDLLAKHKDENRWLVVELKRSQTSDVTIGQLLRYMSWVRHNLAGQEDRVEGLIVCLQVDKRLQYALDGQPNVRCMTYQVNFILNPVAQL